MGRVHILGGKGLTPSVKLIQRQIVLWYESIPERDADIPVPWDGCTVLFPDATNALHLQSWFNGQWNEISGAGGGGGVGVTDHGQLTGLGNDDHTQYLRPAEVIAGSNITIQQDTPAVGSITIAAAAGAPSPQPLDWLTDVVIASPAVAQVLRYSGGQWVNSMLSIDDLVDVYAPTAPSNGQVLTYLTATGDWRAQTPPSTTPGPGTITPAMLANMDFGIFTVAAGVASLDQNTVVSSNIVDGTLTNADHANMPASTLKGNNTGAAGPQADLTVAQVKTLLAYQVGDISGALSQAAADARYLQLAGGTMTGLLTLQAVMPTNSWDAAPKTYVDSVITGGTTNPAFQYVSSKRIDILDPIAGAGGYATMRMYHDNNVDHIAFSIMNTATPGLQMYDSRDPSTPITRLARGETFQCLTGLTVSGGATGVVDLNASGNVTVTGTLAVTGAASFNGVQNWSGNITQAAAGQIYNNAGQVGGTWNSGGRTWDKAVLLGQGDSGNGVKMCLMVPGTGGFSIGNFGGGASAIVYVLDHAGTTRGQLAITAVSNARFKRNIQDHDAKPEKLRKLKLRHYERLHSDNEDGTPCAPTPEVGLVVEDVQETWPELVQDHPHMGVQMIDRDRLFFEMLGTIQHLMDRVAVLEGALA